MPALRRFPIIRYTAFAPLILAGLLLCACAAQPQPAALPSPSAPGPTVTQAAAAPTSALALPAEATAAVTSTAGGALAQPALTVTPTASMPATPTAAAATAPMTPTIAMTPTAAAMTAPMTPTEAAVPTASGAAPMTPTVAMTSTAMAGTAPAAAEATGAPPSLAATGTVTVATTAQATYSDPFAYCAAVGTIDQPDARYAGPKLPPGVVNGLQKALNLPGTPAPPVAQNSFWRCMDGKVYACTVGANLPCQSKADVSKTPADDMNAFCQQQPAADFIPAAVTGHDTIYEWGCKAGRPEITGQIAQVDARGYRADIWYQIAP